MVHRFEKKEPSELVQDVVCVGCEDGVCVGCRDVLLAGV